MADHTKLQTQRPTGREIISTPSYTEDQARIMVALGETAVYRGAEAGETYFHLTTLRLSREPLEQVLLALESIGKTEPRQHEPLLPGVPRILAEMRRLNHPLRHLREIVIKLARAFGKEVDEELLQAYQDAVGHRTDEDITKAYKEILSDGEARFLPSPGQFLRSCGVPKVYRDGSKPE